jgi:hypothetical protein
VIFSLSSYRAVDGVQRDVQLFDRIVRTPSHLNSSPTTPSNILFLLWSSHADSRQSVFNYRTKAGRMRGDVGTWSGWLLLGKMLGSA